jgi:hypothetical protein
MFTLTGDIRKVNPKIKVVFRKQLPMIFPRASSKNPFLTESMLVTSSGTLVPKATIVPPIIMEGTPALNAIKDADSTIT